LAQPHLARDGVFESEVTPEVERAVRAEARFIEGLS
jgi:hypothetical protein